MKRFLLPLIIIMLAACNSSKKNTPTTAVMAFFEAARKGNITELKQHITSQDLAFLEMGQQMMKRFDSSGQHNIEQKMAAQMSEKFGNATISVSDEKIDGDKATVNVLVTGGRDHAPQPFSLQKENGEWKVSLIASGLKASGKTEADLQKGMQQFNEGMKNLPAIKDSINQALNGLSKAEKDSLQRLMKNHKADIDKVEKLLKQH